MKSFVICLTVFSVLLVLSMYAILVSHILEDYRYLPIFNSAMVTLAIVNIIYIAGILIIFISERIVNGKAKRK